jgi:thymidine phosphorylase
VFAETSGAINGIDTKAIGSTIVHLGGGRWTAEDTIDPSVGITEIASVGQSVDSDAPLAVIHAASESSWEEAEALLKQSFHIGSGRAENRPVIYARVEGEQLNEPS